KGLKRQKDKSNSEKSAKDQSRISPTQRERKSKVNTRKSRAKVDKFSKFEGLFGSLKIQGPSLPKDKSCLIKKDREKEPQGLKLPISKLFLALEKTGRKAGTHFANPSNF
ncbi:hypothetical protein Tco_0177012, partial [Tanacetum coccineum]